jgi:hypothetical protein
MTTKITTPIADIASQSEAEAGTATNKFMTPATTLAAITQLETKPNTTSGALGEIYNDHGAGVRTLPSGGQWYYQVFGANSGGAGYTSGSVCYSGIAAGGSTVGAVVGSSTHVTVHAIRIEV